MRFEQTKEVDNSIVDFDSMDSGSTFLDPEDSGILLMKTDEGEAIEIGGCSNYLSVGYVTRRMRGEMAKIKYYELKEIV